MTASNVIPVAAFVKRRRLAARCRALEADLVIYRAIVRALLDELYARGRR